MGSYRSKLDIVADILRAANKNAKKTHIMYQANLSYKILQKYLREITAASLVRFEITKRCYEITPKGRKFLETYKNYSKINKSIEQCRNDVCDKKKSLEELCATE